MANASNEIVQQKEGKFVRFINKIEKSANKVPHPIVIFIFFTILTMVIAHIFNGTQIVIPGEEAPRVVKTLFSKAGIAYMFSSTLTNFKNFDVVVVMITLVSAVSLGEACGLYKVIINRSFQRVPDRWLTYIFLFVAINSNILSDASVIVMPMLGAILFASRGRNPIIGIMLAFAGYEAGLSANLIVAGTDGLVTSVTQNILPMLQLTSDASVHIASNWYFNAVSVFVLTLAGGFVTERYVAPIIEKNAKVNTGYVEDFSLEITDDEKRGLLYAGITAILVIGLILLMTLPAGGALRNPETDTILPKSPFMSSIVIMISLLFFSVGLMYGIGAKKIKSSHDMAKFMGQGVSSMAGIFPVFFFVSIFVNVLKETNMAPLLATSLANFLVKNNITGIPLILCLLGIVIIINFLEGGIFAKWAMLAPIIIPLFAMLGYHPAFAQEVYRIGDSVANTINPFRAFILIILGFVQKYKKDAGIGTVVAYQIPFFIAFTVSWTILLIVWYLLNLPLGPGSPIFL